MLDTLFDATVTEDTSSSKLNIEQSTGFSIQANIGAGLTATLTLEVSNDGTTFTTIASSDKSSTGTAITLFWELADQYAEYVRVAIDWTSGSGTVEIISKKKPC